MTGLEAILLPNRPQKSIIIGEIACSITYQTPCNNNLSQEVEPASEPGPLPDGITAVIQPGGSVRDEEVIAAADEHGIAMVFTASGISSTEPLAFLIDLQAWAR